MSKEWPDVSTLLAEAREWSGSYASWGDNGIVDRLADALETMHDLYRQESALVSLLTGQLDDTLYKEGHVG